MTGKLTQRLTFGLLVWGLLAFLPETAQAIDPLGINRAVSNTAGAQVIRIGGQEAVDKAAEIAGYKSDNLRAVTKDDLKQTAKDIAETNTIKEHASGAANAAKARWKGSKNAFTGTWNVLTGGIRDVFRSSAEIESALEDYATEDNKDNIAAATNAAKALEKQKDNVKALATAAAVYETKDGQKIYVDPNMKSVGGLMNGCVPLPLKLEQSRHCILCPLFVILFNTAQSMTISSYGMLAGGFKNLLLIGFALYVAYVTLKQVSSFTKQDAPKFISELLTMSFKVLLAYLILSRVQELYSLVLEPLLHAAMEFGGSFLFRSASSNSNASFMSCMSAQEIEGATVVPGYFSSALYAKIDCFVRSVHQELAIETSLGSSMMCVARNEAAHWYGLWDLTMFSSGLIIWVFSWLVCLAFGFYLIDAVVRLGVVGGLMPFLIAAWPFKLTSGYTKKGWEMFMNTFFTFVFLGLVVSVNIELGLQAVTGGEGGFDEIMRLINANEVKPLVDIMSIGLTGLLFLILCCIFGFKLCSEAVSLASQMSGGSGGDIGSKIGSAAAGVAKWGATRGIKATGSAAKLAGEGLGVNDKIRSVRENASRKFNGGAAKVGSFLGLKGADAGNGEGGGSAGAASKQQAPKMAQSTAQPENKRPALQTDEKTNAATAQNVGNSQNNSEDKGGDKENSWATFDKDGNIKSNGYRTEDGQFSDRQYVGGQLVTETGQDKDGNKFWKTYHPNGRLGSETWMQSDGSMVKKEFNEEGELTSEQHGNAFTNEFKEMKGAADRIVNESKAKLEAAAQSAAAKQSSTAAPSAATPGSSAPHRSSDKGQKGSQEQAGEAKRAKEEVEQLRKTVADLQLQINDLQKQLGATNTGSNLASGNGVDADQLKKLEEAKKEAERKLNNLTEVLKNQK